MANVQIFTTQDYACFCDVNLSSGLVPGPETVEYNDSIYIYTEGDTPAAAVLDELSSTLELVPPSGSGRKVRDLVLEISGRVARVDNTFDDFNVQYVNGDVLIPTSSGPLTTYQEAASQSIVAWLEGAVGPGNVNY